MSLAVHRVLYHENRRGESIARQAFLNDLRVALVDPRFIWVPGISDHLTSLDESGNEALITHNSTLISRKSTLGKGLAVTLDGSTAYATTPDAGRYSFNLIGLTDLPFTIVALCNVTDTAAARTILSKFATSNREWQFLLDANDLLTLILTDESAGVAPQRASDAAVTQASWRLFGVTYDGSGGATALDGVALYDNGAALASTATNNAAYVAMENLTQQVAVGMRAAAALPYSGSMALVALAAGARSAAEMADIANLVKDYFGVGA